MKKSILIVSNKLNCGGVEKSLISFLQSIDFNKYQIDLVLNSKGGLFSKYIPKEVNLLDPPSYFQWISIPKDQILNAFKESIGFNLNFPKLMYYLSKGLIIRNMGMARQQLWKASHKSLEPFKGNYDIAIDYPGGYKSFILDKVNANKKLTWIHSDYKVYRRDKNIDKEDFKRIDSIVTVSETCKDLFVEEFPDMKDKSHIIPNISNKDQIIKMSKEKVDFDNDYKGIKILDITRLDPNKGIDLAIKACKKLIDSGIDLRWYILGDGPERENILKKIEKYNLEDRFILLGLHSNPYPYIKRSDMIVHCSLFEGKSVAIDEAMLLAKPIILTNYPTAKDQITDNVNGLICDLSVDGVYREVKNLIGDEVLRKKLSDNLLNYDIPVKNSIGIFVDIIA